ncbi:MAG: 16S rRNA (cytidine(1402)-2'-O)-methyltransferase [Candidatus Nealsonbacteria bacterium]
MGILYIVATPIGNLEDISNRALRILSEADLILCEDTRQTRKLTERYGIKTPLLSYHQHSEIKKKKEIMEFLKEGKVLALVSDAGSPGISDPGNKLISELLKLNIEELRIIPIPGPSALLAAASISGFPTDRFLFLGFPPAKKKRNKFFEEAANSKYPVVIYESPFRIIRTLEDLSGVVKERDVVVCRELTKKFETVYRGNIKEVTEIIKKEGPRGEFVIVLEA